MLSKRVIPCLDVRDGKLTLPLIYALTNTTDAEKNEIVKLIDNKDFTTENINRIMRFAHKTGGVEYAIQIMDEYVRKAEKELPHRGKSPRALRKDDGHRQEALPKSMPSKTLLPDLDL